MLEKLIQLLKEGGALRLSDLADQLGVSQPLVEQMIEHLVRAGYLKQVEGCSEGHCTGCSLKRTCKAPSVRTWAYTGKSRP